MAVRELKMFSVTALLVICSALLEEGTEQELVLSEEKQKINCKTEDNYMIDPLCADVSTKNSIFFAQKNSWH